MTGKKAGSSKEQCPEDEPEDLVVYDAESGGNRHYDVKTGLLEIVQTEWTDPVTIHIQELVGTAWDGCTVQDLLDMRVGVAWDYDRDEVDILDVSGYRLTDRIDLPPDTATWIHTIPADGQHGDHTGVTAAAAHADRSCRLEGLEAWSRGRRRLLGHQDLAVRAGRTGECWCIKSVHPDRTERGRRHRLPRSAGEISTGNFHPTPILTS